MPDVSSPLTMSNVWPQHNNASIIASMLPLIFAPNIIEGEYAWNVHKAELESAGMLAELFGWEPTKADGSDAEGTVYALKTYPMNVYNNPVVMDHVINCVLAARDAVEAEQA